MSDEKKGFHLYPLNENVLKALDQMGYAEPTAIQAQTMPIILDGKDLIGLAQTGSGKTAACAIPICNKVNTKIKHIQALIIVPTRELALQYATETQKIGHDNGVKAFAMYGGESGEIQTAKINAGLHVLIATPGRLIDFIYSRRIDLSYVETLILDEADEMLSMGFYDDLEFIIQCLVHEHQTLLFSATMPQTIKTLAKKHMKNPVEISHMANEGGPTNLKHQFLYCHPRERIDKLVGMLNEFKPKQSIIFSDSRRQCEEIYKALKGTLHGVDFLHGGLTQDIRNIVTSKFRQGKLKHLIATDVAARGLDFSDVTHVFIFQLPKDPDVYVHRSGRTGRMDRHGVVTTMVTPRELGLLSNVLRKIHSPPIWIGEAPPASGAGAGHTPSGPRRDARKRPPPSRSRPPLRSPPKEGGGTTT